MDREESKGAYRVTLLFIVVALFALFLDRTQTAASHEEVIELAGATSVHLQLDKCELLYIEEPPRDTTVRFFDDRVSGEQWLEVHITVNPAIQIVQEVSEDGSHFDVRISNMVEPQYARYEGYLCVMEYHYPKGETIPATTVTLSGRHASTISAGRCEVCVLTTKSDAQAPRGCIQPYPFVSDSEDGTCQATPNWGENDVIIQTQDGEKTPAIIGMRNAMMKNLNITVLGNGFVAMTDVHIHGVADVVASSGSVNMELSHAARVEAENKDNRICITDASYYVPEEVVEVDDGGNATNTTAAGGAGGGAVAGAGAATDGMDPGLAALLAALLGAGGGGGGTAEVAVSRASQPPRSFVFSSSVANWTAVPASCRLSPETRPPAPSSHPGRPHHPRPLAP